MRACHEFYLLSRGSLAWEFHIKYSQETRIKHKNIREDKHVGIENEKKLSIIECLRDRFISPREMKKKKNKETRRQGGRTGGKPEDKDSLLRERGPLWMGFVFTLYRATMSPQ
jgi:hypothetical protein